MSQVPEHIAYIRSNPRYQVSVPEFLERMKSYARARPIFHAWEIIAARSSTDPALASLAYTTLVMACGYNSLSEFEWAAVSIPADRLKVIDQAISLITNNL